VSIEQEADHFSEYAAPNLVGLYLRDIGQYELLTADDEYELWTRMEARRGAEADIEAYKLGDVDLSGDDLAYKQELIQDGETAKQTMFLANLRLVVSIANRYNAMNLPLMDRVQYGNLGLERAVDKFDASRGFKFSTLATYWIKQSILRNAANDVRTIRVPVHVDDTIRSINKARTLMECDGIFDPGIDDLAYMTGLEPEKLKKYLQVDHTTNTRSLHTPTQTAAGRERSLLDILEDRTDADHPDAQTDRISDEVELADILKGSMSKAGNPTPLSKKELDVLVERNNLDGHGERTLAEIGEKRGVSRQAIQQTEKRGMGKIRNYLVWSGMVEPDFFEDK
jgi:RNA polymerase sigma factor (sigma-70 family)